MMSGYGLETTSGSVTVKRWCGRHRRKRRSGVQLGHDEHWQLGSDHRRNWRGDRGQGRHGVDRCGQRQQRRGGNVYVKGGQTTADNKDGGFVAIVAGTGGQTSAGRTVPVVRRARRHIRSQGEQAVLPHRRALQVASGVRWRKRCCTTGAAEQRELVRKGAVVGRLQHAGVPGHSRAARLACARQLRRVGRHDRYVRRIHSV